MAPATATTATELECEAAEPKFASWMRGHGKLAVLKDDEVDRLERAGAATMGASRTEVLESMYNRLEPKPQDPSYSAVEMKAMRSSHQQSSKQAFLAPAHVQAWEQIQPAPDLGQDCGTYKWSQTQTETNIFVQVPEQVRRHEVVVELTPSKLLIKLGDKIVLSGQLYSDIKQDESMWLLEDRVLHLAMLKRNRRGNYANRCTNADTFWKSVMRHAPQQERLKLAYPPNKYYALAVEDDSSCSQRKGTVADLQQAQRKQLEYSLS